MYYVVGQSGQAEGPYSADWIRANVRPDTLVSHERRWLPCSAHPDFQQIIHPEGADSGGEVNGIAQADTVNAVTSQATSLVTAKYYVVGQTGQAEGPYPKEWILANARPETMVSHQQHWLPYVSHPDFQQNIYSNGAPSDNSLRARIQADRQATNALASQSTRTLLLKSAKYLGFAVIFCGVVITLTEVLLHGATDIAAGAARNLQMSVSWLVVFAALILPAYGLGRLFGGRGRFSEVVYAFARSIAVLYVVLPLSLLLYTRWFEHLKETNIALALLVILFQLLLVPFVCVAFAFVAIRTFVRCMFFTAHWQAWATMASATIVSTLMALALGNWFEWFRAFRGAMR